MKKVVLLAVNAKYTHSSLAVWIIAEGIAEFSEYQHDVNIVEATVNQSVHEISASIIRYNPDVIGISSYIWNAGILPDLIKTLRSSLPGSIIVLGGPEASSNIDFWLNNGANHVLQGEGEYNFPGFLDGLAFQEDKHEKKGTAENADPEHVINPYTEKYLSSLNGRLSYIEASRGCMYRCSFCLSASTGIKYFPLDFVKSQILTLSKANTKTVKFVDRTFNCDPDRACELFTYVTELDTPVTFHFEIVADLFDDRIFSVLRTAPPGRIQFEIGLQSFHEPSLKAVSRNPDPYKAECNIRKLIKMQNIHIHIDLIAGLPYETLSDFKKGFDRAYFLGAHNLQLGFLKVLHGSVMRKQADDFGIEYSSFPPYEVTSTTWLTVDDIEIIKTAENALQHTYNKKRFLSALHYVLSVTGESPFNLMYMLGKSAPNHGVQLEDYILNIYDFFIKLPGVEKNTLSDCLLYDWLCMVKGKNTPGFMKNYDERRKRVAGCAEKFLCRTLRREEVTVLNSGIGIFVDSNDRDPVTGLYRVYICR